MQMVFSHNDLQNKILTIKFDFRKENCLVRLPDIVLINNMKASVQCGGLFSSISEKLHAQISALLRFENNKSTFLVQILSSNCNQLENIASFSHKIFKQLYDEDK